MLKLGSAKVDAEVRSLSLFGKTVQRIQTEVWPESVFASSSLLPRAPSPRGLGTENQARLAKWKTLSSHRQASESVNHTGKGNTVDNFGMLSL